MTIRVPTLHRADEVGPTAGALVAGALKAAVRERGAATLVLSGGTSPDPVLDWLSTHLDPLIAEVTTVTWTDERVVPYDAGADWSTWPAELNRRAAWERWFGRVTTRPREIVPWRGSGDPAAAVAAWEVPDIDVLLLGIGPDGHLASLFPEHRALSADGDAVLVTDSPKPPPVRLSLTLGKLATASRVVLLASGEDKGRRLREVAERRASTPIGRYVPAGSWDWVVDPAAGAALEG